MEIRFDWSLTETMVSVAPQLSTQTMCESAGMVSVSDLKNRMNNRFMVPVYRLFCFCQALPTSVSALGGSQIFCAGGYSNQFTRGYSPHPWVLPTVKIQPLFVLGGPIKLVRSKGFTDFLEEFIIDNTDTTEGINVVTIDHQASWTGAGSDTKFSQPLFGLVK